MTEFSQVRKGIRFIHLHILLMLFSGIGAGVGLLGGDALELPQLILATPVLAGFAVVCSVSLAFAGKFYCLSVPSETGGKAPLIFSVILDLVGCLITIAYLLKLIPAQSLIAIAMLYLLSQTFFIVFLRKLSLFLVLRKFIIRANVLLGFMLFSYSAAMLSMLTRNKFPEISLPANGVFVLSMIAIFFMYISMVENLRKAIDEMFETLSQEYE